MTLPKPMNVKLNDSEMHALEHLLARAEVMQSAKRGNFSIQLMLLTIITLLIRIRKMQAQPRPVYSFQLNATEGVAFCIFHNTVNSMDPYEGNVRMKLYMLCHQKFY